VTAVAVDLPGRVRLPERVRRPSTGVGYTLRRAWPRSAGHVLLELAAADGSVLAGQWFADPGSLARAARATPAPAEVDPGTSVLLQPAGADRRLVALPGLLTRPGVALLVHRPERRAVVRTGGGYVKVVPPGRVQPLAAAADRVRDIGGGAFDVPALLDRDDAAGTLLWAELSGPSLLELGRAPRTSAARLAAAWRRAGIAVRTLAAGSGACLSLHTAADEAAVTRRWLDHAAALGRLPPVDAEPALRPLTAGPPGPLGVLHRDLHDQQVLAPPAGPVGLLDVDTLAVGEAALDVANVLVHLELRVAQGLLTPARAAYAREAFLAGRAADPETMARIPAYAIATRLRLAGVYAFRPRWHAVARDLLRAALGDELQNETSPILMRSRMFGLDWLQ
jgi:hypothetical protein